MKRYRCTTCGCRWRENPDGTWSLWDEHQQRPLACCDNAPTPALVADDCDPPDAETYTRLAHERHRVSGMGLGTTVHAPCPFCAAEDNLVYRVLEAQPALERGATCKACGRAWRCQIKPAIGGARVALVQTGGAPPAPYLPPMRRVTGLEL